MVCSGYDVDVVELKLLIYQMLQVFEMAVRLKLFAV